MFDYDGKWRCSLSGKWPNLITSSYQTDSDMAIIDENLDFLPPSHDKQSFKRPNQNTSVFKNSF